MIHSDLVPIMVTVYLETGLQPLFMKENKYFCKCLMEVDGSHWKNDFQSLTQVYRLVRDPCQPPVGQVKVYSQYAVNDMTSCKVCLVSCEKLQYSPHF